MDPKIDQEIARLIENGELMAKELAFTLEGLRAVLPMRDYMGLRMRSAELHTGATHLLHLAAKIEALRSIEYLEELVVKPLDDCPQCGHSLDKHHEVEGLSYRCWHGDVAERCRCRYQV